jgi:two-component system cell cycle response regulator DivK
MLSGRSARKGYEVVVAIDGQQGIDMARAQTPDLILTSRGSWTRSKCF